MTLDDLEGRFSC